MKPKELRKLREKAGITQTQLANVVKRNPSTVSSWECGERKPGIKTVQKLADFFEVSVDTLIGREEKKVSKKADLKAEEREAMISSLIAFSNLPQSYYATLSDQRINEEYNRLLRL